MITKKDLAAAAADTDELHVLKTIKAIREGAFIDDLNEALQDAINTATDLGKPATITVKLVITPAGRTVAIDDDIKETLPKAPKDSTLFFLDVGNRLTRKDPKQTSFPAEVGFTGAAAAAAGQ